eukprot:gnl/TRDRNA2_/TRDRNA2_31421_c0_seq1.p1 gnl/TRDRNA2_/TRDRNA2_31421_c0~~gnl/TRDRNA2_/TRDRNA2_31421_c0_seq1.p1  ORF type:complete len:401 (+),score=87.03 gnl/TRDRNA2_/TRDRNA2_31421_c0_seq1:55-1257(+)
MSGSILKAAEGAPYVHPALERRRCPPGGCRGQGVFAVEPLRAGTRLLALPPLATVEVPTSGSDGADRSLHAALIEACSAKASEDPKFAAALWSLDDGRGGAGAEEDSDSQPRKRRKLAEGAEAETEDSDEQLAADWLSRAVAVNAHRWPRGENDGLGLWLWQTYLNHAEPREANCAEIIVAEDVMVVRATKDVAAGEEVLSSYVAPSASFVTRRAILQRCGVPLDSLDAQEAAWESHVAQGGSARDLARALAAAKTAFEEAVAAVHDGRSAEADKLLHAVFASVALGVAAARRAAAAAAPCEVPLSQLLRLQLRGARCLGDMPTAAAAHAALARALATEQRYHPEVLAHWLAHLRASSRVDAGAYNAVDELARFWFGSPPPAPGVLATWAETCGLGPKQL